MRCLLGVGRIFRAGLLEGLEFGAGRVDRGDFGIGVERNFEAPRIEDLWHQADVGETDRTAEGVRAGFDQRFDCIEPATTELAYQALMAASSALKLRRR